MRPSKTKFLPKKNITANMNHMVRERTTAASEEQEAQTKWDHVLETQQAAFEGMLARLHEEQRERHAHVVAIRKLVDTFVSGAVDYQESRANLLPVLPSLRQSVTPFDCLERGVRYDSAVHNFYWNLLCAGCEDHGVKIRRLASYELELYPEPPQGPYLYVLLRYESHAWVALLFRPSNHFVVTYYTFVPTSPPPLPLPGQMLCR